MPQSCLKRVDNAENHSVNFEPMLGTFPNFVKTRGFDSDKISREKSIQGEEKIAARATRRT